VPQRAAPQARFRCGRTPFRRGRGGELHDLLSGSSPRCHPLVGSSAQDTVVRVPRSEGRVRCARCPGSWPPLSRRRSPSPARQRPLGPSPARSCSSAASGRWSSLSPPRRRVRRCSRCAPRPTPTGREQAPSRRSSRSPSTAPTRATSSCCRRRRASGSWRSARWRRGGTRSSCASPTTARPRGRTT
jgi:hypothetical protein